MIPIPRDISLCMVVKNEEHNLRSCFESVRGLVSEMILVDTGSVDGTPQIADKYGALIIPFEFHRIDFSAARNEGLRRARSSWILVLDADETLDRTSAPMVEACVDVGVNAGYILERHNHSADSRTAKRDYAVRLFPNRPDYRYRGRVHETVDESILAGGGRLKRANIRIDHNFSMDVEARRRKNLCYIEILKEEIAADPSDTSRLDFLAAEYHQLGMFQEAEEVAARIAEMKPLDARAHLFLGVYRLLYRSDLVRARVDLTRALGLKPGYREAEAFLRMLDEKEREARMAAEITSCDC